MPQHLDYPFASARAKLAKVEAVLDAMRAEARELAELHDRSVLINQNRHGNYVFRLAQVHDAPSHWPVSIGEILYNLRSALDHAAYALAIEGSGPKLDPAVAEQCEFPIFREPDRYARSAKRKVRGISPDKQLLIERLQPFPGRDARTAPTEIDEVPEYLGVLHDLSRVEKHRLPPIVIQVLHIGSWLSEWEPPTLIMGKVHSGAVFATMPWNPDFDPYTSHQPRFGFAPAIDVAGDHMLIPEGLNVLRLMVFRALNVLDDAGYYAPGSETLLRRRRRGSTP